MAISEGNVNYFRTRAQEAVSDGEIILAIQLLAIHEALQSEKQ